MTTEGSQYSGAGGGGGGGGGASEWDISPDEFSHDFSYYHRLTQPGHLLSGERARNFFFQTNISPQQLDLIWKLADFDKDGCLDAAEFCVAMHIIRRYMEGSSLPITLPPPLARACQEAKRPCLPAANNEHVVKCKKAFRAFQKNMGKEVVSGDAANYLLSRSNLSKNQLYHIWKLADRDEDGHLTFPEFTIAMHLIFVSKLGFILPMNLDPSSVLPHSFKQIVAELEDEQGSKVDSSSSETTPNSSHHQDKPFASNPLTDLTDSYQNGKFFEGETPFEAYDSSTSDDSSHPSNHSNVTYNTLPQKYQIRTGSRRGLYERGHSPSQDSSELLNYKLSSIPEDDEESIGSHDVSHDSSHDNNRTNIHESADEGGVPWYQSTPTHDIWETTPAYHREEVFANQKEGHVITQQVLVTEEIVPVLQVATPVAVVGSLETTPVPPDGDSNDEGEELTRDDLEELENISQMSKKFLADTEVNMRRCSYNSETNSSGVDMTNFEAVSTRGLLASIQDMEQKQLNSSDEFGEVVLNENEEKALDKLETQILLSSLDSDLQKEGVADRSHDDRTSITVQRSHDHLQTEAMMSSCHQVVTQLNTSSPLRPHPHPHPPLLESMNENFIGENNTSSVEKPLGGQDTTCLMTKRMKISKLKEMDDFDSLLEGELASINEMFHEFEIKDRQAERRIRTEEEELKKIETKDTPGVVDVNLVSLEEVSRKRSLASQTIEQQWEKEMEAMEEERLRVLTQQEEQNADIGNDEFLQNIDNELKSLIQKKEEEVKLTQHEKVLHAQREEEERERREEEKRIKEQEREEKLAFMEGTSEELTVEEWISWMEEKKKKGMTPDQQKEYERRKKAYIERERERAERRQEEEEEKKKRMLDTIDYEMRSYRQRQQEIKDSRLTDEELFYNQEEHAKRSAEESRLRKERGEKMRLDDKERKLEVLKPKARSALAARWEESVKSRSNGKISRSKNMATVLSTHKGKEMSLEREEERLLRRMSGGGIPLEKLKTPEMKRYSVS